MINELFVYSLTSNDNSVQWLKNLQITQIEALFVLNLSSSCSTRIYKMATAVLIAQLHKKCFIAATVNLNIIFWLTFIFD